MTLLRERSIAVTHVRAGVALDMQLAPGGHVHAELRDARRSFDAAEADMLTLAVALVAGQAMLAPRVRVDVRVTPSGADTAGELAGLLYGAHAFTQCRATWPEADLELDATATPGQQPLRESRRAVLLWSGGKDALASLRVLRANGFDVIGLHASANLEVEALEAEAATTLAERQDLPLFHLTLRWRAIDTLLRQHSSATHRFPLNNAIPHGRDIVLIAAGAALARMEGAGYVTAGYEHDLWTKTVHYSGRTVVRHDSQSRAASERVDRLMREMLGVGFFSPLAAFSEHKILTHLFENEPEAFRIIASCFWGRWCGRCPKCLRYAFAQALAGRDVIQFAAAPLQMCNPALSALLERLTDPDIPYWEEQVHALFLLHARGSFAGVPHVDGRLTALAPWYAGRREAVERTLLTIHPDDLAPDGFAWRLPEPTPTTGELAHGDALA